MENSKKKKNTGFRWLRRLFCGSKKEMDIFTEEQMQSPMRTVVTKFLHNRLAMIALIVFIAIFLFVMIGPAFFPLDLGYSDSTQSNIGPGYNMMSVPSALKKDVAKISNSARFGVGIDSQGNVYTWGKTKLSRTRSIEKIPAIVKSSKVIDIAAGIDHVVALTETGDIVVWGSTMNGQDEVPNAVQKLKAKDIRQLVAGNQISAVVTTDGRLFMWGNVLNVDAKVEEEFQGRIAKVALTSFGYISLLDDGNVAFTGMKKSSISKVPEELTTGGNVVDITAGDSCCAALTKDGRIVIWGNTAHGETDIPTEVDGKFISIQGGKYHFTALTDTGRLYSWGEDLFGQSDVPSALEKEKVTAYYTNYFQNYAQTESGKLYKWGLKGYILGTDNLGRDILTRLINGGRMTMTVGAVAVIISTIIGVVLGALAGYFGGKVDMVIMRIAEVVGGLPFLPFAMIMSAVVNSIMTESQRIYLIMVILGILSWTSICRLVRAQVFAARESEYVTAAKAMGVSERKIVFRHILPNVISIVVVSATLDFATSMLTESSLSYLGFGVSPPQPTWGNMLKGANNSIVIQQYWWQWVFTSLIFGICTICINTVGDGLRDAIDPKSNER